MGRDRCQHWRNDHVFTGVTQKRVLCSAASDRVMAFAVRRKAFDCVVVAVAQQERIIAIKAIGKIIFDRGFVLISDGVSALLASPCRSDLTHLQAA